MAEKECAGCKKMFPRSEFEVGKKRISIRAYCRPCNGPIQKEKDKIPRYRLSRFKSECKKYGMENTLTVEQYEALVSRPCDYCGASLEDTTGRALDRLDRVKGYTLDNVVPCCWLCNSVKGTTFTHAEMKVIARNFRAFNEERARLGLPPLEGPARTTGQSRTPQYWKTPEQKKRKSFKTIRDDREQYN